jgi:hypothetical protein
MKRGKRELKSRMVALQQKNNRKITHLNALIREREAELSQEQVSFGIVTARLVKALDVIKELKKKKWYQFVPAQPLEV